MWNSIYNHDCEAAFIAYWTKSGIKRSLNKMKENKQHTFRTISYKEALRLKWQKKKLLFLLALQISQFDWEHVEWEGTMPEFLLHGSSVSTRKEQAVAVLPLITEETYFLWQLRAFRLYFNIFAAWSTRFGLESRKWSYKTI